MSKVQNPRSKVASLAVWLIPVAALAVYLYTLTPAVGLIDSGELAAGCRLLNILHPTGYPLYTLLGRLASVVPASSVVQRAAALSAALGAAGTALLLLLLLRMGIGAVAAGVTAAVFAFSYPVWSVTVDVEVHALTIVLVCAVWLAVSWHRADETQRHKGRAEGRSQNPRSLKPGSLRPLLLVSYLCGLCLTNHMSAASVVAGAALALAIERRKDIKQGLLLSILLFMLGLSPYAFLILRAQAGPLLVWGNPVNLERFLWHVTGKQYQVWMFSLLGTEVLANAGKGLVLLARSLLFVLVPVVLYGAARMYRVRRGLCIGLGASAALSFLYAVNYSIPDIEAYFLPCVIALSVFLAFGLAGIAQRLGRWKHALWAAGIAALAFGFPQADRRGDYVAYDQAMNTLASAEQNGIILTERWDIYAPVFYLQTIEGVRPDLCVIDKELARRSWYFDYLAKAYPWLVERSRTEVATFLGFLREFEHGRLRDVEGTQRAFIRMLESFVRNNPARPAYVTFGPRADLDARQMFSDMRRVPVGLLYQLRTDSIVPEFDYSRLTVRTPQRNDPRSQANLYRYQVFVRERTALLLSLGREAEAAQTAEWYRSSFEGTGRKSK